MVKHQGSLDALCGVYAIINALELCKVNKAKYIFQLACKVFPIGVYEGTDFDELKFIISRIPLVDYHLEVNFPFEQKALTPKSNEEYWLKFDEIFSDEVNVCGVIGMTKPIDHWVTVRYLANTTSVEIIDSQAGGTNMIINRSEIFAGEVQDKGSKYLIDSQELIVFSRIK